MPYGEISRDSKIRDYYERNKSALAARSINDKNGWHGFGRSQGINDVNRVKYAINSLIRTKSDIKLVKSEKGEGAYGGLYILTDICENELKEIIYSDDFIEYISMLGKYKSGGYYTFSSKDLKKYLEYKYSQKKGRKNEQLSIFGNA